MQPDHRPRQNRTEGARRIRKRPTDRLEDVVAGALALLLFVAATAAVGLGARVHAGMLDQARVQAATRTQVTAVVIQGTPSPRTEATTVTAQVRWTAPDGVERIGEARVPTGLSAGDTAQIWVDRSQRVVSQPIGSADALVAGIGIGVTLMLAMGFLASLAWMGTRCWTMARECARWGREWARVEPTWSGRDR
jgi:hypothetical protein